MPKPPKQWFKQNSEECPSCFLVLNQELCYFQHSMKELLLSHDYSEKQIPKNLTHQHRLLEPRIFNDHTLPMALTDSRLISSLRKSFSLLHSCRSNALLHADNHFSHALERIRRGQNSDVPLGLILANERLPVDERILNAIQELSSKLSSQMTVSETSLSQATTSQLPSYDASQLKSIETSINTVANGIQTLLAREKAIPPPQPELKELSRSVTTLLGKVNSIVPQQIQACRKLETSFQTSLDEVKNTILDELMSDDQDEQSTESRSPTPKPGRSKLQLEEPDFPTNLRTSLTQPAPLRQPPQAIQTETPRDSGPSMHDRHDSYSPDTTQSDAEVDDSQNDSYQESPDIDFDDSATVASSNLSDTQDVKGDQTDPVPIPVDKFSSSKENIQMWLDYVLAKSKTARNPESSRRDSSSLTNDVFNKYVKPLKVHKSLDNELWKAIYQMIKKKRSKR